jgi:predicted HTH domain antitoxin
MTIDLPENLSPAELRLELACALYQQGKIGKVSGAELAGVSFFDFQRVLGERSISSYTEESLENDLAALKVLFPK